MMLGGYEIHPGKPAVDLAFDFLCVFVQNIENDFFGISIHNLLVDGKFMDCI